MFVDFPKNDIHSSSADGSANILFENKTKTKDTGLLVQRSDRSPATPARAKALAGASEIEVTALSKHRQPKEPKPLLLQIKLQHEVLHLEPTDEHRRRARIPFLHPFHLHERQARRPGLDVHHGARPGHRPAPAAFHGQRHARHKVPRQPVGQRIGLVAELQLLHRAPRLLRPGDLLRQCLLERGQERPVHVPAEERVRRPSAEHGAAGCQRLLWESDGSVFEQDGLDGHVVRRAAFLGDHERRVSKRLRVLRLVTEEEQRAAGAEDGDARAVDAATGQAEEELLGESLRPRDLGREREAGAGEARDAGGAQRQLLQELLVIPQRNAGGDGFDGDLADRVPAVGGVGDEPRVAQVTGSAGAGDRGT